jgi:hypothetical protein
VDGVDPGEGGFLSIFGSDADAASTETTESTDESTYTESASPQGDEEPLSADEVVAARFAASLEADGIEWPDDEEDEGADAPQGEFDLDALTPEQMRALAEEAFGLRQQVSQADREYVANKVVDATQQAIAHVQQQYRRDVLDVSAKHYASYFAQQQAKIIRAAEETQNPQQYIVRHSATLFNTVLEARLKWEAEQAEGYDQHLQQTISQARKSVPEVRTLYAADLAAEFGLPPAAIKEIAKTRSIDDFRSRAEELAGLRQLLAKRDMEQAQQRRVDANRRLVEQPVRTTPNGRPRGGKPPAYKGTADEGLRILSLFHN